MIDLFLIHPVPIAMAAVTIFWALAETFASKRPIPVILRHRSSRR